VLYIMMLFLFSDAEMRLLSVREQMQLVKWGPRQYSTWNCINISSWNSFNISSLNHFAFGHCLCLELLQYPFIDLCQDINETRHPVKDVIEMYRSHLCAAFVGNCSFLRQVQVERIDSGLQTKRHSSHSFLLQP